MNHVTLVYRYDHQENKFSLYDNYNEDEEKEVMKYLHMCEKLIMREKFNQRLDLRNYENIKKLIIHNDFYLYSHPLDLIPTKLEQLFVKTDRYHKHNFDNLPCTLKTLTIKGPLPTLDFLPNSLEELYLVGTYEQKLNSKNIIDNLPSSLKKLLVYNYLNDKYIEKIPDSVEELYIDKYEYPITKLPKNLKLFGFDFVYGQYKFELPGGNYCLDKTSHMSIIPI